MTSNNDVAIRVTGLQKSYKDLHVLRGVDFDVARGSIFALLGSNGAGKPTATGCPRRPRAVPVCGDTTAARTISTPRTRRMQSPHRVSLTSHGVVGTHAMIWAWRHSWCELESTSVPAAV